VKDEVVALIRIVSLFPVASILCLWYIPEVVELADYLLDAQEPSCFSRGVDCAQTYDFDHAMGREEAHAYEGQDVDVFGDFVGDFDFEVAFEASGQNEVVKGEEVTRIPGGIGKGEAHGEGLEERARWTLRGFGGK
jgi:hypothetical protein